MKHSISLNPSGIIEMKYVGPIADDENMQLIKQSFELITTQIDQGKPALVLVDLTETDHFNPSMINVKAMRDSEAIKIAGFGVRDAHDREEALDVVAKSGASDHVRLFDNRDEAIAWLSK